MEKSNFYVDTVRKESATTEVCFILQIDPMAGTEENEISTGYRGDYQWLTSDEDYMGTLVRLCPEVFLGRYLAVTSVDSGSPRLTERQQSVSGKNYRVRELSIHD